MSLVFMIEIPSPKSSASLYGSYQGLYAQIYEINASDRYRDIANNHGSFVEDSIQGLT